MTNSFPMLTSATSLTARSSAGTSSFRVTCYVVVVKGSVCDENSCELAVSVVDPACGTFMRCVPPTGLSSIPVVGTIVHSGHVLLVENSTLDDVGIS